MTVDSNCARPGPSPGGASRIPLVLLPIDLVGWLLGRHAVNPSPAQPASRPATIAGSLSRGDDPAADRQRRTAAYPARIPTAISCQRGHDRTLPAACVLVKGSSLTLDEGRPLLREWNECCAPR
jgi:hypothetical protein